ncbi:hypothetical protein [Aquicoccus sp.]|uniref:hypothetical protein n=1 Tax=Aquicoccus sp. TaxID=2055851 RepID=UPI00356B3F80
MTDETRDGAAGAEFQYLGATGTPVRQARPCGRQKAPASPLQAELAKANACDGTTKACALLPLKSLDIHTVRPDP